MDGYDLFGDDLTNGVLDGLAELGAMESQYASHTGPPARPPQAGSDALQSGYVGQIPSYTQIGSNKPGAGGYPGYSQYGSYPNQQDVGAYQQGMLPSLMGGFQQHSAGLATGHGHNPNPAYNDYAQKSSTANNVRMPNLPNTLQQYAPQQFNAYTPQSHGANYAGQGQHWPSMQDHAMSSHQHYSTEGAFRAQPGYVNTLPRQAPIPSIGLQQPAQSAPVTIPYYTHTATSAPPTQLYPQNTYLNSHTFLGYPNQTAQGGVESVPSSQNYPVVSQSYGVNSTHNQYMPQYSNYYSDQSQMTHHVTPSQPIPNTSHLYPLSFGNTPTPSPARPSYVHAPQATASPTAVRGPAPGPIVSIPGSPHQPMPPQQQQPVRSSLQHLEHLVMPQAQKMMPSPKAQAGNGIMSPVSRPRTPMSPKNSASSSQWPSGQSSAPKQQFTPFDQHKGVGNKPSPLCETEQQQQTTAAPQINPNNNMSSNQNQMRENFLQDNSCYPGIGQGTEKNGHVSSFPSSPAGIKPQTHSVGFNPEVTYSPNAVKTSPAPCPPELAQTLTQKRISEASSSATAPTSANKEPACVPDGSRLGLEQQSGANSGFSYGNAAPCPPSIGYSMPCIPPNLSDGSNNSPSGYKSAETLTQQQQSDVRTGMQMQSQPNIFQPGVTQNEQIQQFQAQGPGTMNGSQPQPGTMCYPPAAPNATMQHPPNVNVAPPPVPDMITNSGQNFYNDKMQNLNSGPPPQHPPQHGQIMAGPQAPYPAIQHEIMTLQQQLQHLYGQPQTAQSQAQIRDIHERLRFLQSQPPQAPPPGLGVMGMGPIPMGQMPLPNPIETMPGVQEVIGSGWETPKGKAPKSPRKPKEAKPKKGKKGALEAENSSQEIPPLVNLGPEVYEFKDAPIEQTEKSKKPRKPRETKSKDKTKGTPKLGRPKLSRKKTEGEDAANLESGAEASTTLGESSFEDGTQSSMNVSTAESTLDTTVDSAAATGTDDQSSQPEKPKKKTKPKTKAGASRKRPSKILIASLVSRRHKRKRSDSEGSDLAVTPPPSPPPEGDNSNKRRSGRHSHSNRKKYVDDLDLILSDEDLLLPSKNSTPKAAAPESSNGVAPVDPSAPSTDAPAGQVTEVPCTPEVKDVKQDAVPNLSNKPNFVYVNPADEDTMIVQHILAVRMGKREILSSSDDEDEEEKPDSSVKPTNINVNVPESKDEKHETQTEAIVVPTPDNKPEQELKQNEPAKEENEPELTSSACNEKEELPSTGDQPQLDSAVKADVVDETQKDDEKKEENLPAVPAPDSANETSAEPTSVTEEKPLANVVDDAQKKPPSKPAKPNRVPEFIDVEEYYVKYKNFSYLHCEWKTEEELLKGDKRVVPKIRRFKQRMNQRDIFEFLEEDPFNPEYTESDRILDMSEVTDPATGKVTKNYLVKWRSLPYDECTWELEDDIDPDKLKQFHRFYAPPPKDQWRLKKRPKPNEWTKLTESPQYKNGNTLRPYQLEGLNWLSFSWFNSRNCILADEMGLGKTIQSLAFADAVYKYGIRGPFLIIAPLSTVPNWQREFETWTDLNVVVYHGSVASRNMIQEYELFYRHPDNPSMNIKDVYKFNVLITTFEIVLTDVFELKDIPFRACIIDEAHRLKNKNCKLLEGLRLLNLEHRVLLSGTPLQNNINELFSLLNFLEPSQFTSAEEFYKEFGELTTETQVQKLQALLKPMMLRRLKEDVEKSIAPKEETIIEVELTNMQKKYYRAILERNFSFLSKGTTAANIPNLMNTMMELRKVCIHPYLLNGAEEQIQLDYRIVHNESESDPDLYHKALITSAGKMVLVDKLLPKLKANGHRVLIFSQMVRCLDILEDYMIYRKYPYERLDGRIRGPLRQAAIDRFSKPDSDRFVFLLCTKAGGLGINLTAADTVIIYDSDWNPQNDLQAQARCHRIGQAKMVKVYRLICRNTYEREMFDRASLKLGLDKAVLQSMNTGQKGGDPNSKQLSKKEVEDLLKRGAYGAIMDEDNAGDKFCEEDIDCILQRRTQVITLEAGEKGSTFSKASFASTGIREDININDPDFWTKWAKKAEIDLDETGLKNELVMHEPRRRTRIKRYGQDEAVMDISEFDSSSDSDEEGNIGERTRGRGKRNQLKPRRSRRAVDEDFHCDDGIVEYGRWSRNECYKIEKGLLCFGWSRWAEILNRGQFRDGWQVSDIEDCARIILIHCVKHFRGDEKVKLFVTDLISPVPNENPKQPRNYSGLENPVSRGSRRNKNKAKDVATVKMEVPSPAAVEEWINNERYDPDVHLDDNYKKHIEKHANKMLLRVRMLYYIKQEIIGDNAAKIAASVPINELGVCPPSLVIDAGPVKWWDLEADASLLVGTHKHGYEKYEEMRSDPYLCFLTRCGPAEVAEVVCKQEPEEPSEAVDSELEKSELPEGEENETPQKPSEPEPDAQPKIDVDTAEPEQETSEKLWPSGSDLNTRLRKLITSFQRNFKKEEIKNAQKVKKLERKEKIEQLIRDRERQKLEVYQKRWSKREEADFFRAVSTYGVQYNRKDMKYDWAKFRLLSKLDKKFDETLTEYFRAFYAMCKRVSGKRLTEQEEFDLIQVPVEPLPEERAKGTIDRIDLLSKIREETIFNSQLEERLKLCLPSLDLPEWWVPGKHDRDLLLGAAKHGLGRTDVFILGDNELSFKDILIQAACPMLANAKPKPTCREEPTKNDTETKKSDTVDIVIKDMKEKEVDNSKPREEEQKSPSNAKPSEEDDNAKDKDPDRTRSPVLESQEKGAIPAEKDAKEEANAETATTPGSNAEAQSGKSGPSPHAEPSAKESEAEAQDKEASQDAKSELNEVQVEVKDEFKITIKLSAEKMKKVEVQVKGTPTFPFPDSSSFPTRIEKEMVGDTTEFSATMEAVNPAALVRWPRDNAIQLRVEHIVYAVENNQWPVSRFFSSAGVADFNDLNTTTEQPEIHESVRGSALTANAAPERVDAYTVEEMPPSNTAPSSRRGRRRRIAIDVEADRAKLQALLQQTNVQPPPHYNKGNANKRDVRRKVGMGHARGFEPPPAHQKMPTFESPPDQSKRRELARFGNIPQISTLDLSIKPTRDSRDMRERNKQLDSQTMSALSSLSSVTVTPLNSESNYDSSLPMDLSSRISERIASTSGRSGQNLRHSQGRGEVDGGSHQPPKSKLESMLSKLKRGRAEDLGIQDTGHQEVPREKKRKKLDEIVFGLSAAKIHQKGPPGRAENGSHSNEAQHRPQPRQSHQSAQSQLLGSTLSLLNSTVGKEFSRNLKSRFATPQNRTESDNLARIDLAKSDFARLQSFAELGVPKFDLFSQDAKVNKWLAEHANLPPEGSTSPETDKKRRKPRMDPTLMDWSKLTGDENISVIHRVSGKKLTGPKAPQLRHLAEWLAENSSYDVDPRWADLVRERGNLPSDLQKRLFSERRKDADTEKRGAGTSPASDTGHAGSSSQAGSSKFSAQNLLQSLSPSAFDPKNPLFMPFGGLGSLGNLASLGNMAHLGMGNPLLGLGMPGVNPADLGFKKGKEASSGGGSGTKKRGDKNAQSASASSMLSGALPFLLSNPGLMYPPLGLGSFPLGANLESHFGSLSGQAALFNAMTNLTEGPSKSSSKNVSLSAQEAKKSSTSRKESNQQAPTPSTSRSQKSVPLSFPQSSTYFEHHAEDSDDESMKSLLDNHTDDLPDDDSPNEHAERVIIKESKDLEKELAEQKQNKRRERRALEDSHHGGLSSMERQLLMSKKRERLAKEESIPSRRTGRTTRSAAAASKTLEGTLNRLKNDSN